MPFFYCWNDRSTDSWRKTKERWKLYVFLSFSCCWHVASERAWNATVVLAKAAETQWRPAVLTMTHAARSYSSPHSLSHTSRDAWRCQNACCWEATRTSMPIAAPPTSATERHTLCLPYCILYSPFIVLSWISLINAHDWNCQEVTEIKLYFCVCSKQFAFNDYLCLT